MKFRTVLLSVALSLTASLGAATLDEAKKAYTAGEYSKALPMFMEHYKKNAQNGSVNHWIGVCLYKTGKVEESEKYFEVSKKRKVLDASLYLALIKYDEYDFDGAREELDSYEAAAKRAKKTPSEIADLLQHRMLTTPVMLDHVEKIAIIDSIVVDKKQFFKAYNLSESSGTLNGGSVLPESKRNEKVKMVYATESGDRMIWSMPNKKSKECLYETQRLYGGEWDKTVKLDSTLNNGGDVTYPFLLQDGVTLYYAGNGNGSIGGYDIFMSRKDIETGLYLQPQNLGMPYNSPFDDYMFALDEQNNVGWWATDRNRIPGKVTIYVFIPNETRVNYNPDDADIVNHAFIKNYKATWGGKNYSDKVAKLKQRDTASENVDGEFVFHVYNGVTYYNYSDFKSQEASSLMEELVTMKNKFDDNSEKLKAMRRKYAKASSSEKSAMTNSILQLESVVDQARIDIKWYENSIRKLENKY